MIKASITSKKKTGALKPTRASALRKPGKPYHHGALRESILKASEAILEQDGMESLTLRAAARAAGVSHAAPKNHFDDLTGLLSELAATGFERFSEALLQETVGVDDSPKGRMQAMGHAYVGYAHAHPGMFQLMFRNERLDMNRPALQTASLKARNALASSVKERMGGKREDSILNGQTIPVTFTPTPEQSATMVAAHSLVHGFSMLLIDHRLDSILERQQQPDSWQSLLDAVFKSVQIRAE